MKELFHKIRSVNELGQEHVVDLLDTIIGRKHMKISLGQVILDFLYSLIPCKNDNLSENIRKRRRIYKQSQILLNRQFDIRNLLRNSSLIRLMMGTIFTKEQTLLLLFQRKQVIEPDQSLSSSASDLDFKASLHAKLSSNDHW